MKPRKINIDMDLWTINEKYLGDYTDNELWAVINNLGIVVKGLKATLGARRREEIEQS